MTKFNWYIMNESVNAKNMTTIVPGGEHIEGTPYFYISDVFFKDYRFHDGTTLNIRDLLDSEKLGLSWRVVLPSKAHVEDFRSRVLEVDPAKTIAGIYHHAMGDYMNNDLSNCLVLDLGSNDLSWLNTINALDIPETLPLESNWSMRNESEQQQSQIWVARFRDVPLLGNGLYISHLTETVMDINPGAFETFQIAAKEQGGLLIINLLGVEKRLARHLIRKAAGTGVLMIETEDRADLEQFLTNVAPQLNNDAVYTNRFEGIDFRNAIQYCLDRDLEKYMTDKSQATQLAVIKATGSKQTAEAAAHEHVGHYRPTATGVFPT